MHRCSMPPGTACKGSALARYLSQALGLDLFASQVGC